MFSCYRAARLTIDQLERPLKLIERVKRAGHLLICRHCTNHDRQIRGLAKLIQMKQSATIGRNTLDGAGDSGLSVSSRSRIAAVLSNRFPAG